MFLYAAGRAGNTRGLGCERLGLSVSDRGTLSVDSTYATKVPGVYAAGDVIGFPALGSTSMDQGRVAVTHMFGLHSLERIASAIPYGIYTIPEVSMVGLTEPAALKQGLEFATIRVNYADIPRGSILGVEHGFLKLVYHRRDHTVLGVHIIGPHATELIHYGMQLVEGRKPLSHITSEVFNYPTLHELYKQAAYAAWNDR
jgi:NAD(P) transhydrogenase